MGIEDNRRKMDEARERARRTIAGAEERRAGRLAELVAGSPQGEAMGVREAVDLLRSDETP